MALELRRIGLATAVVLSALAFVASQGFAHSTRGAEGGDKAKVAEKASLKEAKVSDAEIAAIVLVANTIDVENGKLALSRSKNSDVKAFAERMIVDHTAVNKKAAALAGQLKLEPKESAVSKKLAADGDSIRAALAEQSGRAFDRAYVTNEVAYHEAVLAAIDELILPSVTNEELKALLVAVRPAFVMHLEHAQELQKSLGS